MLGGCTEAPRPHLQRLKAIQAESKGHLSAVLRADVWSGDRLRVTGMADGFPITESIGEWRIELVPEVDKNVVRLQGLLFASECDVSLDMDRDVLTIDGHEFAGLPIADKSPMFQDMPFEGVAFERVEGPTAGRASIIFLEDGRTVMDFDKVVLNGVRAREYGVLSPE
jgi:hypothetical protein